MLISALVVLTLLLLAIAVTDFRSFRIPDILSLTLVAAGLAWSAASRDVILVDHVIGAVAGYASLAAFGWAYFAWRGREGLGLGDAKLFAAAGAWLGWRDLPAVLLLAAIGGLLFAVWTRRTAPADHVAFGPWLAISIWLIWIYSNFLF